MDLNGIGGVVHIGIGVMLGFFASTEPDHVWRIFVWAGCVSNGLVGARLLSRAYREAYRGVWYDE